MGLRGVAHHVATPLNNGRPRPKRLSLQQWLPQMELNVTPITFAVAPVPSPLVGSRAPAARAYSAPSPQSGATRSPPLVLLARGATNQATIHHRATQHCPQPAQRPPPRHYSLSQSDALMASVSRAGTLHASPIATKTFLHSALPTGSTWCVCRSSEYSTPSSFALFAGFVASTALDSGTARALAARAAALPS